MNNRILRKIITSKAIKMAEEERGKTIEEMKEISNMMPINGEEFHQMKIRSSENMSINMAKTANHYEN